MRVNTKQEPKHRAFQNGRHFLGRLVWREVQTISWIQLGKIQMDAYRDFSNIVATWGLIRYNANPRWRLLNTW